MTELNKRWNKENPEKYRAKYTKSNAARYSDPARRFDILLRNAVSQSLAGRRKYRRTFEALGYSREDLMAHIERQFTQGMKWENYGEWHLDHIVPLSSFEYSSSEDEGFKLAWAITNLRPLWAEENMRKRDTRTHLI